MAEQITTKKKRNGYVIASVIALLDVLVLILGLRFEFFHITWSIGSVGVITFFGTLMLINQLSESQNVDKGEMRKAMAASFIIVYFALLSLLTNSELGSSNSELSRVIIEHFTYLVGIIIVFYFGSSTVREYINKKQGPSEKK
jgi:hypothetical protein